MRALLLGICLAGCAAEPVPYHSGNEIPRGPGLLTGAEGEVVLKMNTTRSAAPRNAEEEREFQEWRKSRERQETK